jgi:hypothetical protein
MGLTTSLFQPHPTCLPSLCVRSLLDNECLDVLFVSGQLDEEKRKLLLSMRVFQILPFQSTKQ